MIKITLEELQSIISTYKDSYFQMNWVSAKIVKNIDIKENHIDIELIFGFPLKGIEEALIAEFKAYLNQHVGNIELKVHASIKIESHVGQRGLKGISNIKNIIPIASGKGGVGKSTLSVNLAIALAKEGAVVGILDADIYGPSQPMMLGATHPPEIQENKEKKVLLPIKRHGIQSMSIGYLINPNTPMIWRGPMVTTALQQLLNDTQWENLDYLIIDLPPGTGDIQLTMAQKIPVSAAVIVTTPQDLALLDARRAYEMFKKVNIPVLGIVENMSHHTCSNCNHSEALFGEGGGEALAKEYSIDLLGNLPLDKQIREQTDKGLPTVAFDPNSFLSQKYRDIARKLAAKLSEQAKDYSNKFPSIVVQ